MEEEVVQTGVEHVSEADSHIEEPTETPEPTGEEVQSEAGTTKGDPETAWEKRISSMRQKWEQEVSQKYGDYDTIKQRTSYLEKRARQEGFNDVESYLQAIDEYEQRQQIEQESQRIGLDPDTYAQYFQPVKSKLTELEQEVQTYRQEREQRELQERTNQVWGELYKQYPSLMETASAFTEGKNPDWYNPQMQQLVNMGYQPIHAYELAHKETLFKQKEQEVLARVTGRDERQILPSKDQPNNVQFDPANMTNAEIEEISRRVRNGERITF